MILTPRLAVLLTLPPLMWAGNALVGRLLVGQVPPLTLNWLRWAVAALILLPLAWKSLGPWAALRQRWRYLMLLGLLGVGLYNALQYLALVSSTPINVTLVASSTPVWMMAVGALFFGVPPTRQQLVGALLSLGGVLLVIARGSLDTLLAVRLVPGDLYIVLAAIGWAFYSWLLARPPAHMQGASRPPWDWAAMLWIQTLFGLIAASSFALLEQAAGAAPMHWSPAVAAALLFVAIGPSIVAYRCWGLGVAEGGPAMAAFFANLTPVFAALLSTLVLGDAPRPFHALAFLLIVAGIVVSSRAPRGPSR